jgi:3-methyladenine DNA glycosylase AlkD
MQDMVDNWALSDSLSKIYSKIFEIDSELIYPVLSDWNKSENPWKRRQSIVSLLYYSSTRKNVLPFIKYIRLIKRLLTDDDYYVQKGVGWTLRELGNVYSEET